MTGHPRFLCVIDNILLGQRPRKQHGQEHPTSLRIQRWRRFSSVSRMCFVYTPEATNSAPSFIITASTRSPSRSTNVTPLTSTTHFRFPFWPCDFSQFDLSCATHGPERRPCRFHRCSVRSSRIEIRNSAFSVRGLKLHTACHSRIQN